MRPTQTATAKMRRPRGDRGLVRACIVGIGTSTAGLVVTFVTAALAPELRRVADITAPRLGVAIAVFFAFGVLTAPLCGRLADRVGSVRVMRVGLVLSAVCTACVAAVVWNWAALVAVLAVAGGANGAIGPAANRYISRVAPERRQGLALGIKQAAIPAGALLGGLSVPVAAYVTGWRGVYVATAVLTLAIAATVRVPPGSRRARGRDRESDHPVEMPTGPLLVLAAGWALGATGGNALGSFFVLGAVDAGFSHVTAALMAAAGALASISVRIGVGYLADRWIPGRLAVIACMHVVGAVAIALLATEHNWAFIFAAVVGYGIGWGWAGLFNYAVVITNPGHPGRVTGITQAAASAGACLGPLVFGALAVETGYRLAWLVAGGFFLLASLFVLTGRRMLSLRDA